MSSARKHQRGFTLTEMLVVMAIIGIMAGLTMSMIDPAPRAGDAAQTMAAMVREASRRAVMGGMIRDDVAINIGTTARTRVVVSQDDSQVTIAVDQLVEAALPADTGTWVPLGTRKVPRGITLGGWTPSAQLTDGQSPTTTLGDGDSFEVFCYPEGTCDGVTIYFEGKRGVRARTAVLPLGGTPLTYNVW